MPDSVIITPSETDLDMVRGYRLGKWGTRTNYECVDCQYSTIFKEKILKHIEEGDHPWPYPVPGAQLEDEVDSDEPTY